MTNYKKIKFIVYNGVIVLSAFLFLLAIQNITPFGDNNLLITDLNEQYINYFAYLKSMFSQEGGLFYSFSKAIGGGLEGLYAYYLLSPFNVIFLFFDIENFHLALTIVSVLKILAIGTTSFIFFCEMSEYKMKNCLFSLAFCFSAYNMIYLQNIMWLDAIIFLPLVILGVENIINKHNSKLFIISLTFSIICNFYIAFMICIFSVLYIIFKLYYKDVKDKSKFFIKFCISGLLSAGISAVVILPTIVAISKSFKGITSATMFSLKNLLSVSTIIKQFILPEKFEWNFIVNGPANLFCGIAIVGLFLLFFFIKSISRKNKVLAFAVTAVIILSFIFEGQMLLWHGGAYPIWFLYRNAFIFVFWAIYLAFEVSKYIKIKDFSSDAIITALIAINMISLLGYDITVFKNMGYGSDDMKSFFTKVNPVIEEIKGTETDKFYRIEKTFSRTRNDNMLLAINGISHYSTADSEITKKFAQNAGYKTTVQWINYARGASLSTDSFLGIKYILSKYPLQNSLQGTYEQNGITAYKNDFALPLGFATSSEINNIHLDNLSPYNMSNSLYSAVLGEEVQIDASLEDNQITTNLYGLQVNEQMIYTKLQNGGYIEYKFFAPVASDYYIYPQEMQNADASVVVQNNGIRFSCSENINKNINFIGNFFKGETVTIKFYPDDDFQMQKMHIFYTDRDVLKQATEKIKSQGFDIQSFRQDKIIGKIYIDEPDKSFFLTVPYDKGWRVYVDGKKAKFDIAFDTFINIPLSAGEHTVILWYIPQLFIVGAVISLFCVILAVIYYKKL